MASTIESDTSRPADVAVSRAVWILQLEMLVILRIRARMRALQADLKHGNPHHWAQRCFYAYTASVCVKTVSVLIMPFCLKCECKEGVSEGDAVRVAVDLCGGSG